MGSGVVKKTISFFLAIMMAVSCLFGLNICAYAAGEYFTYDNETKTLTIISDQAMIDYNESNINYRPWRIYNFENLVISSGVTKIGDYDFARSDYLESVVIPDTVTSIGKAAFSGCDNLTSLTVPSSVQSIGDYAFGFDSEMNPTENFVASCDMGSVAQKYCLKSYVPFDTPLVDDTGEAFITESHGQSIWSYVAPADGILTFYDTGSKDTYGLVYDANSYVYSDSFKTMAKEALAKNEDNIYTGELSFRVDLKVEKGKRYYLSAKFSSSSRYYMSNIYLSETGRFTVKTSFVCTNHDYIDSNLVPATCTAQGSVHRDCKVCGYSTDSVLDIDETNHSFADGICIRCGVDQFDFSAYSEAVAEYNEILKNTSMYTNDSVLAYKATVEEARATTFEVQDDVNSATNAIITAKDLLTLKTFSFKAFKVVEGRATALVKTTVSYGDTVDVEAVLEEGQSIYKWTSQINDGATVRLANKSTTFSTVIYDNTIINCFVDVAPQDTSNVTKVTYLDKANKTIKIDYVEIGSAVDKTVVAPEVAYYNFNEWQTVSGNDQAATSEGVVLKAAYTYSQTEANTVLIVGVDGVLVNGLESCKAYYDEKITLSGANSYSYGTAQGVAISGIQGDYIFAPNNQTTLYIVPVATTKASTMITGWVDENNSLTINAQYYMPESLSVIEAGIVLSATDPSPTIDASGCVKVVSQTQGDTGEYSVTLGYSKSGTLNACSYVTYRDSSNNIRTAYSEASVISLTV